MVLESLEDCTLPRFSGSYLRGTFGHSLKSAFCVMAHKTCTKCMVSDSCGYFQIFESQDEAHRSEGYFFKPHPYIITPSSEFEFKKGGLLEFSITIFGPYISHLPYFVYSFDLMGKLGFGEKRHKFALKEVKDYYSGKSVFDGERLDSRNISNSSVQEYAASKNLPASGAPYQFLLTLESPARFVENKKEILRLTPEILLESMARRYKTLHQFYGEFIESDLDLGNLQLIPVQAQKYRSWNRYSNRQSATLKQGGILGSYQVSLTEPKLAHFLQTMEILHVGKSTTFGLGKVKIDSIS